MILLHIDVQRGHSVTHDDRDVPSIVVSIEILGLVLAWWIGVRR